MMFLRNPSKQCRHSWFFKTSFKFIKKKSFIKFGFKEIKVKVPKTWLNFNSEAEDFQSHSNFFFGVRQIIVIGKHLMRFFFNLLRIFFAKFRIKITQDIILVIEKRGYLETLQ